MADITPIIPSSGWHIRESPSSTKFTSEISNKVNTLISNELLIHSELRLLLQGSEGGSDQARILFALASAPTGWSRDLTVTTDSLLMTGDLGSSSGGGWTVSGLTSSTVGAHQHTFLHVHSASHTHSSVAHSHTMSHTHTEIHTHGSMTSSSPTVSSAPAANPYGSYPKSGSTGYVFTDAHYHTYEHTHGTSVNSSYVSEFLGSTSDASPTVTAYYGNTDTQSVNVTSESGGHAHSVSVGSWRPKYLNMLACKKD